MKPWERNWNTAPASRKPWERDWSETDVTQPYREPPEPEELPFEGRQADRERDDVVVTGEGPQGMQPGLRGPQQVTEGVPQSSPQVTEALTPGPGRSAELAAAGAASGTLSLYESFYETPWVFKRLAVDLPSEALDGLLRRAGLDPDTWNPKVGDPLSPLVERSSAEAAKFRAWREHLNENNPAFRRLAEKSRAADGAVQSAMQGDFAPLGRVLADPEAWAGFMGQAAPTLAVAMLSGGSPAVLAWMEGMEAAKDAREFEEQTGVPLSEAEFARAVTQVALVNSLLERAGLDRIMGGQGSPTKQILRAATAEGATETLQELNQNAAAQGYDESRELTEGLLAAAMGGAGTGGAAASARVGVEALARDDRPPAEGALPEGTLPDLPEPPAGALPHLQEIPRGPGQLTEPQVQVTPEGQVGTEAEVDAQELARRDTGYTPDVRRAAEARRAADSERSRDAVAAAGPAVVPPGSVDPEGGALSPEVTPVSPEGGVLSPEGGPVDPEGGPVSPEGGALDSVATPATPVTPEPEPEPEQNLGDIQDLITLAQELERREARQRQEGRDAEEVRADEGRLPARGDERQGRPTQGRADPQQPEAQRREAGRQEGQVSRLPLSLRQTEVLERVDEPALRPWLKQRRLEVPADASRDEIEAAADALEARAGEWRGLNAQAIPGAVRRMRRLAAQRPRRQPAEPQDVDAAANQAATSPRSPAPEPSPAQIEAGNYRKGHLNLHGLDVSIENPKGSTRSGTSPQGRRWTSTLRDHYGYIRRTEGRDGDQLDVFVGPRAEDAEAPVYVIDQVDPQSGRFDEHKVMLGYGSRREAEQAYRRNYQRGWRGLGTITEMTVPEFKEFVAEGNLNRRAKTQKWGRRQGRTTGPGGRAVERAAEQIRERDAASEMEPLLDVQTMSTLDRSRRDKPPAWREELSPNIPQAQLYRYASNFSEPLSESSKAELRHALNDLLEAGMPQSVVQGVYGFLQGFNAAGNNSYGRYFPPLKVVELNQYLLNPPQDSPYTGSVMLHLRNTLAHELGHFVDMYEPGVISLESPLFSLPVDALSWDQAEQTINIRGELGPVIDELLMMHAENAGGARRILNYPFARLVEVAMMSDRGQVEAAQARANWIIYEAFAQAHGLYYTHRELLRRHAPRTLQLMEEIRDALDQSLIVAGGLGGVRAALQAERTDRRAAAAAGGRAGGAPAPGAGGRSAGQGVAADAADGRGGAAARPAVADQRRGGGAARPQAPEGALRPEPEPLDQLPASSPGPNPAVREAARRYMEAAGLAHREQRNYVRAEPERGRRIANAFEAMRHNPQDPEVAAAYRAMIDETLAQYQAIKEMGLRVEIIEPGMPDPYPEGPRQVHEDVRRGHLWVFPTDSGFGTTDLDVSDNPLLAPTDEYIGERRLLANDVFRIVHDVFGHTKEGVGFGPHGEENAWQSHVRMYSPLAARAMTTETRGQNSWVNFGPFGEHNRSNQKETVYADQKVGLLPEWVMTDGLADDREAPPSAASQIRFSRGTPGSPQFRRWFADSKVVDERGRPLVVYHGTRADVQAFDLAYFGATDQGESGVGFYFTPDPAEASWYAGDRTAIGGEPGAPGGNVIPAYLSIQNPYHHTFTGFGQSLDTEALRSQGYDGVITRDQSGRVIEYVAFEPHQVKSAIGDVGPYDPGDPRIAYQRPAYAVRGPGLVADRLRRHVGTLLRDWDNAPRVDVVQGVDELPPALRREIGASEVEEIRGLYRDGRAYLIADNLSSLQEAEETLIHEVVGHYGLRGVLGPGFDRLLDLAYDSIDTGFREQLAASYEIDTSTEAGRREVAEEALAWIAQTNPRSGLWQRFVRLFRDWLRRMGFRLKLSRAEIADLIAQARDFVARGRRVVGDPVAEVRRSRAANTTPSDEVRIPEPRRTRDGKYFGAPQGKASEAEVEQLVERLTAIATDPRGVPRESMMWYENAGRYLRGLVRDPHLRDRIVRATAVLSADSALWTNVVGAIDTAYAVATGRELTEGYGRYPQQNLQRLRGAMAAPVFDNRIQGVSLKVMSFYRNLRDATEGTRTYASESTLDVWMHRAFGYRSKAETFNPPQYAFGRMVMQRVADRLSRAYGHEVLPRQAQAMIWTAIRNQNKDVGDARYVGYEDYFDRAAAVVTWEAHPSLRTNLLPMIGRQPVAVQRRFVGEASRLIIDERGNDQLLARIGVTPLYAISPGVGAYEGQIAPNTVTYIVLPKGGGRTARGGTVRDTQIADLYANSVGLIYQQDAVPWHRADPGLPAKDSVAGVQLLVREGEVDPQQLYDFLRNRVPAAEFSYFIRPDGRQEFRFLNFAGHPDKEYTGGLEVALRAFTEQTEGVAADAGEFRAAGNYLDNDWEAHPNGEVYLQRLAAAGRRDLSQWAGDRRQAFLQLAENWRRRLEEAGAHRDPPSHEVGSSTREGGTPGQGDTRFQLGREAANLRRQAENLLDPARGHVSERSRRAVERVRRLGSAFNPLQTLPNQRDYLKRRYLALGEVARIDSEARAMYDALAAADEHDAPAVYRYLTSRDADPQTIRDPQIRAEAKRVKRALIEAGEALVSRGLLSEQAFEANRGAYLPRLYLKHLLDDDAIAALGTGKKPTDMGYLKRRRDIPESVRRLILGEITDPAFLAAKGFGTQMRDVALLDWLADISTNADWVLPQSVIRIDGRPMTPYHVKAEAARIRRQARYYTDANAAEARRIADRMEALADEALGELGQAVPAGYKQFPNTPRYGALRGLVVRREIYDDIVGSTRMVTGEESLPERLLNHGGVATKATQLWKWSKVAANPPAQVRNFVSNASLLHLSGVPAHRVLQRLIQAIHQIRTDGEYWQLAKRYGITESTFSAQELFRIEREFTDLRRRQRGTGFNLATLHYLAGRLMDVTGDVYQLSEAIFKTAKMIDEVERRGSARDDAVLEAQKWLFDYSLVSPGVRYLRNAPVGAPFLTFYIKVLPRMLEVAVRAPWRFAPYVAVPWALAEIIAHMEDVDDDDLEALKKALPRWLQQRGHAYFLPGRDEQGRWRAVDVGYFLPWTMWTELATQLGRGEFGEALVSSGLLGGPIPDMIAAVKTNTDPFTQREIVNEHDPPRKQLTDLMLYLYQLSAPTWLTGYSFTGHMYYALTGAQDRHGDPRSTVGQAALRLFGVNVYPIDPLRSRADNLRRMRWEISQIKRRRTQALSDRNLTAEQRREITREYAELIRRRSAAMRDYARESRVHPNLR